MSNYPFQKQDSNNKIFDEQIFPMFEEVYEKLRGDLVNGKKDSVIFTHHIDYVNSYRGHYVETKYEES